LIILVSSPSRSARVDERHSSPSIVITRQRQNAAFAFTAIHRPKPGGGSRNDSFALAFASRTADPRAWLGRLGRSRDGARRLPGLRKESVGQGSRLSVVRSSDRGRHDGRCDRDRRRRRRPIAPAGVALAIEPPGACRRAAPPGRGDAVALGAGTRRQRRRTAIRADARRDLHRVR